MPAPVVSEPMNEKDNPSVEVSISEVPSQESTNPVTVPLHLKLAAFLLVSAIGFGSSWSGGITGAMKSTLKKMRLLHRPGNVSPINII